MNVVIPVDVQLPAGVSLFRDARGLNSFADPACAAAIWDRQVPPEVLAWLADLSAGVLPNARIVLQPAAVKDAVSHLCDLSGMPDTLQRAWLVEDVSDLASSFAALMQAAYVRLRLQAVTTNACRKFHLDAITGRLVCTYRGPGTQYGTSTTGEDPEHIRTVPTGAPILLRGSLWRPVPDSGLLHRSPPIEGTGETRFVLVLDPVLDLDEAG